MESRAIDSPGPACWRDHPSGAPIHLDPALVVSHEDDLAQAGDLPVVLSLLSAVVVRRARAEHLDDERRVQDRVLPLGIALERTTNHAPSG